VEASVSLIVDGYRKYLWLCTSWWRRDVQSWNRLW
jgi:hypothetical protein